jgi:type I restriction enzyme M protein
MNERITENLVRNKLRKLGYYKDKNIIVEEQQSKIPKIDKSLSSASKKGNGKGYPEFIIHSTINTNFVIVIECKADIKKHESENLKKYAEYAVDGSLLYASYLSKNYDVLAIGISGQNNTELKITQHIYPKESNRYYQIYGNKLLTFNDYINGYLKSEVKFNQDYSKLLDFTKDMNDVLYSKKIKEAQRSLLISGILIALGNEGFKKNYKTYKKAEQLAQYLITIIINEISNSEIPEIKINKLKISFSFILTNVTLTTDKEFFENLIESIDKNVNSFMKTYKYFDTLGQFYIEFLRYANNDKGLGIVLTPPHITELFSDIVGVNKDNIVFDNCCGTGGFLISAMKKMIKDAKHDSDKIRKIKNEQLIGIEFQDDIYILGISNMIIHNDGKTNYYLGDCFKLSKKIGKDNKPNIGFLNPPYKTKKSDIEELSFVIDNLNALSIGGKCVAIIPLSCAISLKGGVLELKKKILKEHTLEAVMSMPEDLFHNSKVSVVTCVMVITAHIPHPKGKKTWLGYWRNDGFKKTKSKGRIDLDNVWENRKKKWINTFINREIVNDLSLTRELVAKSEWCIEAYMKTDYSKITFNNYIKSVKLYMSFRLLNDLLDFEIVKPKNKNNGLVELVPVDEIFDVYNGLSSSNVNVKEIYESENDIRYIRPSQTYAGSIAGYVDEIMVEDKHIYPDNTIYASTDGQGSHSYTYLSSFRFVPNSNVSVLIPKEKMTIQEKIYYTICITINRYRFSYGRKPKGNRLRKLLIPSFPPDFVYTDVFANIFNEWKKTVK